MGKGGGDHGVSSIQARTVQDFDSSYAAMRGMGQVYTIEIINFGACLYKTLL